MSNTMQLTEKNLFRISSLMYGDLVYGNYENNEGEEVCTICKVMGYDPFENKLWVESHVEQEMFDSFTPIPLTEDVLGKIEGVTYDSKQNGYFVTENLLVRVIPTMKDCALYDVHFFEYTHEGTNCICIVDEDEYYLHQLQQLCRCLGRELVINF